MSSLPLYAILSVALGVIGILTTPGYNPSFDFGIALILLGLYRRESKNGET